MLRLCQRRGSRQVPACLLEARAGAPGMRRNPDLPGSVQPRQWQQQRQPQHSYATVRKTAFLCGSDSPSVCPEPVSANQLLHDVTRQTKGCFPQGGPRQVAHARRRLEAGRVGLGDADPSWMSYATNPNGPWCALPSSYTSTSITANIRSRLPVSRNCIGLHVVR